MKKFIAILMTVFLLASALGVAAVPASAAPEYTVTVCGLGKDGVIWAIGLYEDFGKAWNEAIYYATHLEEAWNSAVRYESEADRPAVEGFDRIIVDFYGNWRADSNGSFGSGIGFQNGAIYVPSDAKITVDLRGHAIHCGLKEDGTKGKTMHIDAGADVILKNGTVAGDIHADNAAKLSMWNVYASGNTVENATQSAHSASILSIGSPTVIIAILALAASVVSICLTVALYKKKAIPMVANAAAETEDEES
jgi:hypothetical protein